MTAASSRKRNSSGTRSSTSRPSTFAVGTPLPLSSHYLRANEILNHPEQPQTLKGEHPLVANLVELAQSAERDYRYFAWRLP